MGKPLDIAIVIGYLPVLYQAFSRREQTIALLDAFAESDAPEFIDAMMDVDVNHYLPDCLLVKVDIATMAHGLEGRSPLQADRNHIHHRLLALGFDACPFNGLPASARHLLD